MKKKIYLLCTILWILVIFSFSTQDAKQSSQTSNVIVEEVAEVLKIEQASEKEVLSSQIRELAHGFEFFVLGVLMVCTWRSITERNSFVGSVFMCVLIACCDELIQLGSAGRAFEIKDIVIDSFGATVGCGLFFVFKIWKWI